MYAYVIWTLILLTMFAVTAYTRQEMIPVKTCICLWIWQQENRREILDGAEIPA